MQRVSFVFRNHHRATIQGLVLESTDTLHAMAIKYKYSSPSIDISSSLFHGDSWKNYPYHAFLYRLVYNVVPHHHNKEDQIPETLKFMLYGRTKNLGAQLYSVDGQHKQILFILCLKLAPVIRKSLAMFATPYIPSDPLQLCDNLDPNVALYTQLYDVLPTFFAYIDNTYTVRYMAPIRNKLKKQRLTRIVPNDLFEMLVSYLSTQHNIYKDLVNWLDSFTREKLFDNRKAYAPKRFILDYITKHMTVTYPNRHPTAHTNMVFVNKV